MKNGAPDSSKILGAPCRTVGTLGWSVSIVISDTLGRAGSRSTGASEISSLRAVVGIARPSLVLHFFDVFFFRLFCFLRFLGRSS